MALLLLSSSAAVLTMHHVGTCDECGRPPKGSAGSWCELPPNCTTFSWDANHVRGPDLSTPGGCAALPCDTPTFCYEGGYDLWAATSTDQPPCPYHPPTPPPPPPPPPPPYAGATWHLPTRCEEGDVNALFEWEGTWHLMQQWAARPHTSVGHAVSTDLLRWARLPDVLASGAAGDEYLQRLELAIS
jgi:hypothetical protein